MGDMSMNNIQIPFDVLGYWYHSALEAVERYETTAVSYIDPAREEMRKERYKMAKKTVETLKDVFATVEIIDSKE